MKPVFENPLAVERLRAAMAHWRGTPFAPNSVCPGPTGGVSCQMLVAAVYAEAGFPFPPVPAVPMNHWKFSRESLIEPFLAALPEFVLLGPSTPPIFGDILAINLGKCAHHVAIYVDPHNFFHVTSGAGAGFASLIDPTWGTRLAARWRRMERE